MQPWVVYTYDPGLLESLGTFRFLLTERVPLQLILEHRGTVVGLSGDDAGPASRGWSAPPADSEEIPF